MTTKAYDHYRTVGHPATHLTKKKRRPKLMAVVDEDNCTGCQVCVPFCPTNCIETVPKDKYTLPIPPVQIRFHECIGCQICARACSKLAWDAIRMYPIDEFESGFGIKITDTHGLTRTANDEADRR